MIRPGTLDLSGDRWTPLVASLRFTGIDLTDAVMAAQVRLTGDAAGAALVDLATVTVAGAQGVRLVSVDTSGAAPVSLVELVVAETTMEGLPAASEVGDDALFAWDLLITPAGGTKQRYLKGAFTVEAGVTQ